MASEKFTNAQLTEQFNQVADIRLLLLSHPDRMMIKAACLHFLGDKFQNYAVMLNHLDEKLPITYNQSLPEGIDTLQARIDMLKHEITHLEEVLQPLYREFYNSTKKP